MKAVVADYRYRCHGLRIECANGLVVRLTDYPRDLVMSGQTYRADNGYQFTGSQSGTNLSPAVMDLEGVVSLAGIARDAIASGVFDGARLYCFATSWRAPVEDEEPIGAAILGKATLMDDRYRIEMMALIDALGQSVGRTYAPACDKIFGGQEYAGCGVDLAAVTVTGTLTAVTSPYIVRDAARAEPADWFGAGTIRYTSGPNVGLAPLEIKRFDADGTIETFEPAYYPPTTGDAYELVPGCRKRLEEDCKTKWNNVLNFGGFPFVPTGSTYGQIGTK